ncbi:MAG TPA: hypothetical protein PK992_01435, partial [Planctomycetaceae bacterium]|nr:hypothetical protein [Planctomycetaceae bacterium]
AGASSAVRSRAGALEREFQAASSINVPIDGAVAGNGQSPDSRQGRRPYEGVVALDRRVTV